MIKAALLIFACAAAADIDLQKLNTPILVNNEVLQKLSETWKSNRTIDRNDLAKLNKTVQSLGVNRDLIAKFAGLVTSTENSKVEASVEGRSYTAYGDEIGNNDGKVRHVEESPDYASSVVLASDLLSLTSAVASVKETACREQGYKFLDGLIMNRRWALKSEYFFSLKFSILK